jgi:putative glutamine amidotransferase
MRPLVGITSWRRTLDTFYGADPLHTLTTYYVDSVIDAGMTPVILPNGQDPEVASRLVSTLDGLLLSGGDDVDPASYGEEVTATKRHDIAVDRFEAALIQAARAQGKPVLAICRGLQILNVALGGSLHQEVNQNSDSHPAMGKDMTPDDWEARAHVVHFEGDSTLAGIYGSTEAKVNSLHHQGVSRLADGLIVEGRTDDGLIEAARHEGDWWALGVQWHPERMEGDHQGVFSAFREAILSR